MGLLGRLMRTAGVVGVVAVYLVVVWLGMTEESRRSLTITKNSASDDDYVVINVKVTSVDEAQGLLHERIRLIPKGRFAIDRSTPAVDLKMLINSVSGKQTVMYPKGERISPVDFNSVISGNLNRYPFDKYSSDIDILVTAPRPPPPAPPAPSARLNPLATPAPPAGPESLASTASLAGPAPSAPKAVPVPKPKDDADEEPDVDPITTALVVGVSDVHKSELVPIKENFAASITGVKFEGEVTEEDTYKMTRTSVALRRANNVILVSIIVMVVMFVLAISTMVMALRVLGSRDTTNLLPLSLCVTLIFGLPALRSTQPGVPGIGALCDYLSFIWAEFIVATSAIGLVWTWIIRSVREQRARESQR